jgi:L-asparaginase/Glu-tRNA(Gln) amidotransferase subunit D
MNGFNNFRGHFRSEWSQSGAKSIFRGEGQSANPRLLVGCVIYCRLCGPSALKVISTRGIHAMSSDRHTKQFNEATLQREWMLANLNPKPDHQRAFLPKIAVLLCGGTIWMNSGYEIREDDAEQLLLPLRSKGLDEYLDVQVFPVFPRPFDSANARWVHWVTVAEAIRTLYGHFDGFVIVFGTDGMAHLMAALHFILPNVGKPIVGVGSQVPMTKLGEDGSRNLYFALCAASANLRGAHLAFDNRLMHGLHVWKTQGERFDAFCCPSEFVLGEFTAAGLKLRSRLPMRNKSMTPKTLRYNGNFREGVGYRSKPCHTRRVTPPRRC